VVGRGILQNAFSDSICSKVGIIHGDGAMTMPFFYGCWSKQTGGSMHGGRSEGVRRWNHKDDFLISPITLTHVFN